MVFESFYSTVGDAPNTQSRLNSLRQLIWDQGDDTIWQQIGFKLDRIMNAVYIAWVNALMLIILFLTSSTVDVILNALAIDFLYKFDNEIPHSTWFDPDYRYLKASCIEMLLRAGVLLELVESPRTLCKSYDIDKKLYEERVGGPLQNEEQARKDLANPKYMTAKDKIWMVSGEVAQELHRQEGVWQFLESVSVFGLGDYLRQHVFGGNYGIFHRFDNIYTWSLWDEALFLPGVPALNSTSTFNGLPSVRQERILQKALDGGNSSPTSRFSKSIFSRSAEELPPIWNYDPTSEWQPMPRFFLGIVRTLRCRTLQAGISVVIRRGKPHHVPFRLVDGLCEWVSFIFLIFIFPLWLVLYFFLIIECQPLETRPGPTPDEQLGGG
jgi:hypothetical protein